MKRYFLFTSIIFILTISCKMDIELTLNTSDILEYSETTEETYCHSKIAIPMFDDNNKEKIYKN